MTKFNSNSFSFKILYKSKKTNARMGLIQTPHGKIKTPAFVPCATKGTLKSLVIEDLNQIKTQIVFVNTYHVVVSCGIEIINKAGGIHKFSNLDLPIITDSGGFQIFSLKRQAQSGKSIKYNSDSPTLVKIDDGGVKFRSHINGNEFYFTPEFSIEAQQKIGADFIVAFDQCLPAGATRKQAERSVGRTYDWANRSIKSFNDLTIEQSNNQKIFGVIQGGIHKDLRRKSAKDISSLPFWGLSIGGVAVGESKLQMRHQVKWVFDEIQDDPRPRHLLGVGDFDDISDCIAMGVDTFDCVSPTRLARMGRLYTNFQFPSFNFQKKSEIDIFQHKYKNDLRPIDKDCCCYSCVNYTRAYLHHLFKTRELTAYRLATIHNLQIMENFMKNLRGQIEAGKM